MGDYSGDLQHAIESRFELRNQALKKDLEDLAARAVRGVDSAEKLGVKLRLICELDMLDRAQMAWAAIKKVHQEYGGLGTGKELQEKLNQELDDVMRQAALQLASQLRIHAKTLAIYFRGPSGINAEYVYRLRRDASERQRRSIEEYVGTVRGRMRSLLSRS